MTSLQLSARHILHRLKRHGWEFMKGINDNSDTCYCILRWMFLEEWGKITRQTLHFCYSQSIGTVVKTQCPNVFGICLRQWNLKIKLNQMNWNIILGKIIIIKWFSSLYLSCQEWRRDDVLDIQDKPGGSALLCSSLPRCHRLHEEVLPAHPAILIH